jgi:hypothetical protein
MKHKEEVVVYWAPCWDQDMDLSFDMYYHEPENVYLNLSKNFFPPTETKNYMQCPATMDKLKKNYVIFARTDIDLGLSFDENNNVSKFSFLDKEKVAIGGRLSHSPTLKNQFLVELFMSMIFFSEEPLTISVNSPFFHQTPHLRYGAIVPGEFDIGRWFRPINLEFNLWPNVDRLKIDAGEPLVYFNFDTDKKIVFKRFSLNKRLLYIAVQMARYKEKPKWTNLISRYQKFKESSMKEIIMKEIKDNLV